MGKEYPRADAQEKSQRGKGKLESLYEKILRIFMFCLRCVEEEEDGPLWKTGLSPIS